MQSDDDDDEFDLPAKKPAEKKPEPKSVVVEKKLEPKPAVVEKKPEPKPAAAKKKAAATFDISSDDDFLTKKPAAKKAEVFAP